MDLIHEDSNHAMLGAIDRYELDLAFGSDENDFECTMAISDHCCSIGDYLAMQDVVNGHVKYTEYGGLDRWCLRWILERDGYLFRKDLAGDTVQEDSVSG